MIKTNLVHENVKYDSDQKKVDLFAELLSATFKDNEKEKYDEKFKIKKNKKIMICGE